MRKKNRSLVPTSLMLEYEVMEEAKQNKPSDSSFSQLVNRLLIAYNTSCPSFKCKCGYMQPIGKWLQYRQICPVCKYDHFVNRKLERINKIGD